MSKAFWNVTNLSAAIHWCRQNPGSSDRKPSKTDQTLLHAYRLVKSLVSETSPACHSPDTVSELQLQ